MFLKAERLGNFVLLSKNIRFIDRIKTIFKKRFITTSIILNKKTFTYTDSLSFMTMYNEIFQKRIYDYNSDEPIPVIYDCGSNIGLSVIFFKLLYPEAELHAFEPDPEIFKILSSNMTDYGFNNLHLHQNAVWKNEELLSFSSQGGSSGKIIDQDSPIKVKAIRLSEWLTKKVDFLKIDIEGAEFEVLKDCALVLHNVKNMFIEYHSFIDEEQFLDEILLIIKKAGFKYYIQHETSSRSPFIQIKTIGSMNAQLNLFCYR